MEPSRRVLSQIFSLFDEEYCGSLTAFQFFNLVRTLVSMLHGKLVPIDSEEVNAEGSRIASRIRIRRENYIAYDEFVEACEHRDRQPSPFEPFFGVMKVFFTEANYAILNEIFPFKPTYEYQTLYDWQSVPPNCESILPLSDPTLPPSRRSSAHPLACYGSKKARISEECQFSLRIGKPPLLDPVRVRLLRGHTVAELLERAVQAWPAHHRPAPPSDTLSLVHRRTRSKGDANNDGNSPCKSEKEQQWEEVTLEPFATVEQVGLFFHYRECEIHVQLSPSPSRSVYSSSFTPPPGPGGRPGRDAGSTGTNTSAKSNTSTPNHSPGHRQSPPQRKGSPVRHNSSRKAHRAHSNTARSHPSDHPTSPPAPVSETRDRDPQDRPREQHANPPPPSPQHAQPTSAQLLVARLGDDFSRLRVQMQQETRRLAQLLSPWEDSLTLLRDELPPQHTSWPDGSVLTDVDREDLRVQANALKEDLRALQSCLDSLHGHAKF
mmetsp:Transcript_18286/g.30498  ORF Transcript_18286/g.30498 Transcript_18286/m.30498 type:complete len:492 (+) Transcript_18286:94-1569(+)